MKVIPGFGPSRHKVVLSLCDYSGNWPQHFSDCGYTVVLVDLKHGDDVLTLPPERIVEKAMQALNGAHAGPLPVVVGVLMACPCTDFAGSGARWWPAKDEDGRTAHAVAIVRACLALKDTFAPDWWALENPVGRLSRLVPELGKPWYFNPFEYARRAPEPEADRYTKRTGIWGDCVRPLADADPLAPIMFERGGKRGSWMWAKLGGKSERTKELRSNTPKGFARAFAEAQMGQKDIASLFHFVPL